MEQESRQGYYGSDGEFYPTVANNSGNVNINIKTVSDKELYPKRPEFSYTTKRYPEEKTNTPLKPVDNEDEIPDGYVGETKYCKYCGKKIPAQAVICTKCGCQVEEMKTSDINNVNNNAADKRDKRNKQHDKKRRNKWAAFFLCLFFGGVGAHKFYEGKIFLGVVYILTAGFWGIGVFVDLIVLLTKTNPYYV